MLVPLTVLPEIAYLLQRRIGPAAELAFVRAVGDGELGLVDASIAALAERLGARSLVPTDRRHVTVVRPAHLPALALLP